MNTQKFTWYILFITFLMPKLLTGQTFNPERDRALRIVFYNTENTFDTINDPETEDDEFIPGSIRHWNGYRYYSKIKKLYKTFIATGGWQPPEIIGLCEIENKKILEDLVFNTPFNKFKYKIIHKDSPDKRGIDVAAIYNPKKFKVLEHQYLPVILDDSYRNTREILYLKGHTNIEDTLHLFFNHWPSKWGGALKTEPKRICAAKTLRKKIDSLFDINSSSKIIVTGDFNDTPKAKSIIKALGASSVKDTLKNSKLYNLSSGWNEFYGTHKYQGKWAVIDQFIVSSSLLKQNNKHFCLPEDAFIYFSDFLLETDDKFTGKKPFRTFVGYRYHGGYSDHLPIILDIH